MIGIFVVARLGSTRLSQKHLIQAAGRSFIEWLIGRFTHSFKRELDNNELRIFIVTSDRSENQEFERLFHPNSAINVFYGSDTNIPLRQLQCAQTNDIDAIISIDGDDILCSVTAAREVYRHLLKKEIYIKTTGLPLGMNVTGYRTEFLKNSLMNNSQTILETGWGRIFDDKDLTEIRLGEFDKDKRLRLTLDYEEDARLFDSIIISLNEKLFEIGDHALIQFILENQIYKINQDVNDKYWQNFDFKKKAEL